MRQSFVQVITTLSGKKHAEKLTKEILDKRLGACVQIIGPFKSVYRWKGRIEKTLEWACVIKTRRELYKKVENAIRKIHPYEIPEIIAIPIIEGSSDYLKWLSNETTEDYG
ncbi:MAG: divalent-cation tolerance protein CutA [Candidatus Omnitrophota bacterium]|nr:divalent-cation tolerance protein CutA [Candidatus Omnitrophota bacterium]